MTGRFAAPRNDGVVTLSTRQSSLSTPNGGPPLPNVCGAVGPKSSASLVPVQAAGFTDGMKRFRPAVVPP